MIKDRIAKLVIPKHTCYCYTPKKGKKNASSWLDGYKVKVCPYWKQLEKKDECGSHICYCKYLKQESEKYDPFNLIWDMVKECGINDEWEDD